ncbi:endolytic transglycosylase MltG [Caldinitratiruptor microaerophilus]|uniref:endolytic transglycosylase MltG n=1 Tax=Caldinitratiruptor microaerophilus TaxID=671077 RepID=UPI002230FADD|nr:endolytic transglycosylase MltG [Caldinitratiruptor microaerophilus]
MRRLAWALAGLGLVLAAGGAAAAGWAYRALAPVDPADAAAVTVVIPEAATAGDVARVLREAGLVRDARVVRLFARFLRLDQSLKPGEYSLSRSLSVRAILEKLARGEVVVHRVTIPEGLTVEEIASLLEVRGVVRRDDFLAAARRREYVRDWLPDGAAVREPLEGYLFPATYEYRRGVTAEDLVELMVGRLRQVFTPELQARAKALGLSVHEVLTLASIVEEEARVPSEMPRIAGVYRNRLKRGWRLEADPTVRYAVRKPAGADLTYADLDSPDPYNTYRVPGLPPGPISSPGEAAIRAVLWPEEHRYLFFVARQDGSGEHIFSETFAEHRAAMARVRAARRP